MFMPTRALETYTLKFKHLNRRYTHMRDEFNGGRLYPIIFRVHNKFSKNVTKKKMFGSGN